jgi:succinoglycan biosynthesis transport protein ExoP
VSRKDEALRRYRHRDDVIPARPRGLASQPRHSFEQEAPVVDEMLEVWRLLWELWKRKGEIALITCLVVIPVAAANFMMVPLYRSSAMVQIDPEPVQVLPYREIDLPSLTPNYEMFMKSQEQILRGPRLVERIAERLQSGSSARLKSEVSRLSGGLSIQRIQNTQLFRLSYVAADPDVAAKVANTFAEEYIKLHFETRQETREKARELLKHELDTLEERVQISEKELVEYQQKHDITGKEPGQGVVPQKLTILGSQLADAEREVFVAKSQLESLQQASASNFPQKLVTPAISGLTTKLLDLEHDLTALRATFGEKWPAVVQKRDEIALVRDQLQQEHAAALAQAREQAALDYSAAENKRKMIASSMDEQERMVHQIETASIQYNILRREVDTNQKMYEALLERLNQTSVTAGMAFGGFHVIEQAVPDDRVYSPRTMWNLSLASVLGLSLGICFVLARHYWDNSVSTVEEVERVTALPVLGSVPQVVALSAPTLLARGRAKLPRRMSRPTATVVTRSGHLPVGHVVPAASDHPGPNGHRLGSNPATAEGVRNICASVLLSQSGRPPRLLMVTSSVPGEGKTTLASELGYAFAESGKNTLLIECDLRRPRFGTMFGIGVEGGLSMFLSGLTGSAPTIHPTSNACLFVVGAGPTAPNPPTLLGSDKMGTFLREMMNSFHFVILDTPPVLPMADSRLLARMADGVVLVVRAGLVPKALVRRVCGLLETTGANVLGAVLNAADPHDPEGPYSRYYQDYYQS